MSANQENPSAYRNNESVSPPTQESADTLAAYLTSRTTQKNLSLENAQYILHNIDNIPAAFAHTLIDRIDAQKYQPGPLAPAFRTLDYFSPDGKPVDVAYRFEDSSTFRVSKFYPDETTNFLLTGVGEPVFVCLPPSFIGAMTIQDYEYYRNNRGGMGFSSSLAIDLNISRIMTNLRELRASEQERERAMRDETSIKMLLRWFHRPPESIELQ